MTVELRGTAAMLAYARNMGYLHQPGEVSKEESAKIAQHMQAIMMHPPNQQAALANFKVMLANDAMMQTNQGLVDAAMIAMGRPERSLMNTTVRIFSGQLQKVLKGMLDAMKAAFPQQADKVDPALTLGVKMAVLPKMGALFADVEKVSRAYIGNQIANEKEAEKVVAKIA